MDHDELVKRNKAYSLASWIPQKQWNPLSMSKAEGAYFWDADGNRYLDWSSQLFNVNIGHKDRHSREPMSPFNAPLSEPMRQLANSLRDSGMSTVVRWNWIFCAPPLIINEQQLGEGMEIVSRALSIADKFTAS